MNILFSNFDAIKRQLVMLKSLRGGNKFFLNNRFPFNVYACTPYIVHY
jgi:hypothetical protein